jgi:hypothetical protein
LKGDTKFAGKLTKNVQTNKTAFFKSMITAVKRKVSASLQMNRSNDSV